jgi:hypothetical protein
MKALQRRILVVTVYCGVGDTLVFQELDEIDCKEALPDAAFAVED